ncbi:hypothetical protein C9I56_26440 [Paraburkholderia caribensis]|nr:hypothetical protein C9I56_26440 [Paraburkholderia caribensis]
MDVTGEEGDRGRTATDNRWFPEAVLWIGRTGSAWRYVPMNLDPWHTLYIRFPRWRRNVCGSAIALAIAGRTEVEQVLIDPTIVRAHQHSVA